MVKYLLAIAVVCLLLWGGVGVGKLLYPERYLEVNYFFKTEVFRELGTRYSKPWNSVFLCVRDNGEVMANYQSVDLSDVNMQKASKAFSSFQVDLPELVILLGKIDGYCFYGEKRFFQIESDLGSMDYHVGYVFFYDSLSAAKRDAVFKKNFSHHDMHHELPTLKNMDGNWYRYEFVE